MPGERSFPMVPWGPEPQPTVRSVLSLADELDELLELLAGEVTEEVEQRLAAMEGEAAEVIGRLRRAVESYEARAEHLRSRAKAAAVLAKSAEGRAARCEGAVRLLLERLSKSRLELDDGDVVLGRYRVEALAGASVDALPPSMVREVHPAPRREPNKVAIGEALERGETVPGYRRVRGVSFR